MPTITVYLPDEVFAEWKKDKNRKGVIAKLIAQRYGLTINESRVTIKESQ